MFFQILNVILVVVITLLVIVAKGLPKHIFEIMMENMKHKNAKQFGYTEIQEQIAQQEIDSLKELENTLLNEMMC